MDDGGGQVAPRGSRRWAALALAIPLTMLLTAYVGVSLERIAYRPLRKKGVDRLYVVITALMCGLILEHANLATFGASRKAFPTLLDEKVYTVAGVSFTNLKLAVIATALLVFLLLQRLHRRRRRRRRRRRKVVSFQKKAKMKT